MPRIIVYLRHAAPKINVTGLERCIMDKVEQRLMSEMLGVCLRCTAYASQRSSRVCSFTLTVVRSVCLASNMPP